ncbi:MAG: DUF3618 domain-containing protein [Thermoleophilaceae bacterium]|nr:DUF3618 domain-containing protein [Thermoleophilaceae bacterium]
MSPEERDKDPERPGAIAADKVGADPTEVSPRPVGVEAAPDRAELPDDPEVLRAQIDETRAELGDTVEALTAKADIKGQVKEKVEDKKEQLREQQDRAAAELGKVSERAKSNPAPFAVGGVAALLVLILLRRRGRR